jgi:hypothetical protein
MIKLFLFGVVLISGLIMILISEDKYVTYLGWYQLGLLTIPMLKEVESMIRGDK